MEHSLLLHYNSTTIIQHASMLTYYVYYVQKIIYGTCQKLARIEQCNISLLNDQLVRTRGYKYLGIYLDSRLNFNVHIDNCYKLVPQKEYTRVFKSIIAPLMVYKDILYSASCENKLSREQRLQHQGLKFQSAITDSTLITKCGKCPILEYVKIHNYLLQTI